MAKQTLRILCFGDSLTAGYSAWGSSYHPYSQILDTIISSAYPHLQLEVVEDGLPGDIVSAGNFLARLNSALTGSTFDWVIILGGTNDLGYGIDEPRVFGCLKETWDAPLSKGSKVLALTVPECAVKKDSLDRKRNALNASILGYQKPNFHAFDLHSKIPYHSLAGRDRDRYWDDGLHLTADGYDWMGGHIAVGLLNILSQHEEGSQAIGQPVRISRRVGSKPGDELAFEEESGDPGRINEGYVVVRKKDLD